MKNDANGKYRQALLPGRYQLSFDSCIKPCGEVSPKPPDTVDVTAGKFTTIDVQCTVFGK